MIILASGSVIAVLVIIVLVVVVMLGVFRRMRREGVAPRLARRVATVYAALAVWRCETMATVTRSVFVVGMAALLV